jgi:hypothetical protein
MSSGEKRRWEILREMDPAVVCRRADALFEERTGLFTLRSFCWEISVSPAEERIIGLERGSDVLLERLGYFTRLSVLWYLTNAKDIPLSGHLVNTVNLKGGQLFFRGSHILPLDSLSQKYGQDTGGFMKKGKELGGEVLYHGEASQRLFPLPRVRVVVMLSKGDEEFPPEAKILFDSTSEIHLPVDIIWSVAMMSLLIML